MRRVRSYSLRSGGAVLRSTEVRSRAVALPKQSAEWLRLQPSGHGSAPRQAASQNRATLRVRTYSLRLGQVMPVLLACGAAVCTGCGPAAEITLAQPRLAGRQHELQLHSACAYWAPGGDDARLLAEFPLPGAVTGKPMYLLYLRWPASAAGAIVIGRDPASCRGFFIQARGRYAGLASIVSGQVDVAGQSQSREATRTLRLDLSCEDGTRIQGRVRAGRDDYSLRCFETDRRPADVQTVLPSPTGRTQPADAGEGGDHVRLD